MEQIEEFVDALVFATFKKHGDSIDTTLTFVNVQTREEVNIGRVDELLNDEKGRCNVDECQKSRCQFLITGGDPSKLLEQS